MSPRRAPAARARTGKPDRGPVAARAVIELGTTSIRMAIAQYKPDGALYDIVPFQQPVSLGKDTFTLGVIGRDTTERCVEVLRTFQLALREAGLTDERQITTVGSSAIREAENRDDFLDRIYIATGLNVQPIDAAEVNRFTYLAVSPYFDQHRELRRGTTLVIEVGGGSTETLVFKQGRVASAHMYPYGSLRLRRQLEELRVPHGRLPDVLRHHAEQTVKRVVASLGVSRTVQILVLGGDARFVCTRLRRRPPSELDLVPVRDFARVARDMTALPVDEIVRQFQISYPDAETLAPALTVYAGLMRELKLRSLLVGGASLRDGILAEVAANGVWSEEYQAQIINSALHIARKYDVNERHASQVARYALDLFALLRDEHKLGPKYEVILHVSALLHDIGNFVNRSSHHKHSQYLIANSEVFGLGVRDLQIAAVVARYHRRAEPDPTHEEYRDLAREDRITVSKLAAILRIANALDRDRIIVQEHLDARLDPGRLVLTVRSRGDITLEQQSLRERCALFEQVYGLEVVLHNSPEGASP